MVTTPRVIFLAFRVSDVILRFEEVSKIKNMDKPEVNSKLEWCEDELRVLLKKLIEGNYHITAEHIFDHVARSGVDMKLNPDLEKLTLEEFIAKT